MFVSNAVNVVLAELHCLHENKQTNKNTILDFVSISLIFVCNTEALEGVGSESAACNSLVHTRSNWRPDRDL